jgi:hypothetical protein
MVVVSYVCMMAARGALPPPTAVALIEDGHGVGEVIGYLRHLKRIGEPWTVAFDDFVSVSKSEYPVQAADLLAYETWWELTKSVKNPSCTWNQTRHTFKILAAGSSIEQPAEGRATITLKRADENNFRESAPKMRAFLVQHHEYGWPRGHWKTKVRRILESWERAARKFVRGKLRWLWYGVLGHPNARKRYNKIGTRS